MLKTDQELNELYSSMDIIEPLEPRQAFKGGRVEPLKLYYTEEDNNSKVYYYDFCSLYPAKMSKNIFPLYHPKVILNNFLPIENYFGLIKADVIPPRQLLIPILPYVIRDKLMFVLCYKCAENNNQLSECSCSDSERMLPRGVYVSEELKLAVQYGYTIHRIYEIYHYEQTSENTISQFDNTSANLFSEFVKTFMKIKQSASGWPKQNMSEDEKKQYINDYKTFEDITLDYNTIQKNPGKRFSAKICMNSLFGKLGQSGEHRNTKFINSEHPEELMRILTDPRLEIKDFNIITNDIISLEYEDIRNTYQPGVTGNAIISAFITAYARMDLFHLLIRLSEKAMYADTDSVIFQADENDILPPTGPYLGELTSELNEGDSICEFVCTGPKSYSYLTEQGDNVLKFKGFSLNYNGEKLLNHTTMCNLLVNSIQQILSSNSDELSHISVTDVEIHKQKKVLEITTRTSHTKKYQFTVDKRRVLENYSTLPFGY